jgi:hypothetical protein
MQRAIVGRAEIGVTGVANDKVKVLACEFAFALTERLPRAGYPQSPFCGRGNH